MQQDARPRYDPDNTQMRESSHKQCRMCSTTPDCVLRQPTRTPAAGLQEQLKYYTPAIHAAAFVLPRFAERAVAAERRPRLPHVASSVPAPLFSRSSLALAGLGAALGASAMASASAMRK